MDSKVLAAFTVFVGAALALWLARRLPPNRWPPGPKPLPVIGNALQLPKQQQWLSFAEWRKIYGDVITITIFGQKIVILNSHKVMVELLEHRSKIYSNRPHLVMANELMGWGKAVVMLPYGDRFKASRKLLKTGLSASATKGYWPLIESETAYFLQQLLGSPDDFVQHIRRTAGAIALKIAYDYDGSSDNRKLVTTTEEALEMFSLAALPGSFLVDTLPFLKYIPAWMPFAAFQRTAIRTQHLIQAMIDEPFNMVRQQVAMGTARLSFTSSLLQDTEEKSEDEVIKWVSAGLYSGQSDTTVAAMSNFFLAMMLHPGCQKRAQEEIDAVIGRDRLPSIADRVSLPYVDNVLKEVLRWHPVVPMVSHSVVQHDVYRDFHIPAGTALLANIWASLHDETVYKLPEEFRPERFSPPENAPDSFQSAAFGFGRRVCPGIVVAHASLFCAVAATLATFNIQQPVNAEGKPIQPELIFSSGVVSHPKPFKCLIQPRSQVTVELILASMSGKG